MGRNRRLAMIDSYDEEDGEFDTVQCESRHTPKEQGDEYDPEAQAGEKGDQSVEDAKPVGEAIKVSGKGKHKRWHFQSFEYDGNSFELEDSVLLSPEERGQKPYVAIIKEITQERDGSMMVLGQWFYRPEEAEKRGGGSWESRDTRELFYSFHRDEVPAESVMHKCQAHFIPQNKQIPDRSVHPGFIIQKVYDTVEKKLFRLTDNDYEENKQHEIDILVQKTREHLGELADLPVAEDGAVGREDLLKDRRGFKRKNMAPLDASKEDNATFGADQILAAETPGIALGEVSEYYKILANSKALTGESTRDKWLEKLLQSAQCVCDFNENVQDSDNKKGGSPSKDGSENVTGVIQAGCTMDGGRIRWPDDVVPAVVALEKAAHDAFDSQKFKLKMRQMVFNLKNARLTKRLINGELEALVVLHMSPSELREALTKEEMAAKEPEESRRMQMTDARCQRCQEKQVALTDIIQAGGRGDRYQLECIACGNIWYAFRDEISTLTIDVQDHVPGNGCSTMSHCQL